MMSSHIFGGHCLYALHSIFQYYRTILYIVSYIIHIYRRIESLRPDARTPALPACPARLLPLVPLAPFRWMPPTAICDGAARVMSGLGLGAGARWCCCGFCHLATTMVGADIAATIKIVSIKKIYTKYLPVPNFCNGFLLPTSCRRSRCRCRDVDIRWWWW